MIAVFSGTRRPREGGSLEAEYRWAIRPGPGIVEAADRVRAVDAVSDAVVGAA